MTDKAYFDAVAEIGALRPDLSGDLFEWLCSTVAMTYTARMMSGRITLREMMRIHPMGIIIEHGKRYIGEDRPKGVRKMRSRQCYANSLKMASKHPRFIYCEGFGSSVIPMHHAWLFDSKSGGIVDPTWDETKGREYIGIKFAVDDVRRWGIAHECYGLFANLWRGVIDYDDMVSSIID